MTRTAAADTAAADTAADTAAADTAAADTAAADTAAADTSAAWWLPGSLRAESRSAAVVVFAARGIVPGAATP
ncbi:hypothetical protein MGAST_13625 [Mycobacterium gastri 'Wayne']|uniref:Uncharacterized protein n=1 Tax=Mycobacterium gastri TaxID=1777 RepID=A0A1X1UU30_MYCGS|nr:hypothetical protein MGAST_13625 [Mycobacterium gastri 'Wayne']ORV60350.1 hypothetical protein AWC07_18220 [Mycobacterium gastri]